MKYLIIFILIILAVAVIGGLLLFNSGPDMKNDSPLLIYAVDLETKEKITIENQSIESPRPVGVKNFSYNPATKEKKLIKEHKEPTYFGALDLEKDNIKQLNLFRPERDKNFILYYLGLGSEELPRFIKSDLKGNVISDIKLGASRILGSFTFPTDQSKLAWCSNYEQKFVIKNTTTREETNLNNLFCSGSGSEFSFSRDGNSFYYNQSIDNIDSRLFEDYKKAGVFKDSGLHKIDIKTNKDVIVYSPLEFTPYQKEDAALWTDSNIHYGGKMIFYPTSGGIYDKIEKIFVRKLKEADFDYLTPQQIEKLDLVGEISAPGMQIDNALWAYDGKGILFTASRAMDNPKEIPSLESQLGYFDAEAKKLHFPILKSSGNEAMSLFAAIDKNHLYITESGGLGEEFDQLKKFAENPATGLPLKKDLESNLYEVDLSGKRTLIEKTSTSRFQSIKLVTVFP